MLPLALLDTPLGADPATRRVLLATIVESTRTGAMTADPARRLAAEAATPGQEWLLPQLAAHPDPWLRGLALASPALPATMLPCLAADPEACAHAFDHDPPPARIPALLDALATDPPSAAVLPTAARLLHADPDTGTEPWTEFLTTCNRFLYALPAGRATLTGLGVAARGGRRRLQDALLACPAPWHPQLVARILGADCTHRPLLAAVAADVLAEGGALDSTLFTLLGSPLVPAPTKTALAPIVDRLPGTSAAAVFTGGCWGPAAVTGTADREILDHLATLPPMWASFELAFIANPHIDDHHFHSRARHWTAAVQRRVLAAGQSPARVAHLLTASSHPVPDRFLTPAVTAALWHQIAAGATLPEEVTALAADRLAGLTEADLAAFTWRAAGAALARSPHVATRVAALVGQPVDAEFLYAVQAAAEPEYATVADVLAAARAATHTAPATGARGAPAGLPR